MFKKHQILKVPFFLLIVLLLTTSCFLTKDDEKALGEALQTVEAQLTQTAEAENSSSGVSVDEAVAQTVAASNATATLSVDEIVALTVAANNATATLSVDEIVALTVAANEASSNSGDSDTGTNTGGDASGSEPTLESVKVEVDPNTASGTPQLKVNTSSINVRRGPGTNYRPISSLLKDSVVEVIAKNQNDSWYLIKLPNGELGWVANSVTDPVNEADMAKVSVAATIPAPPTNTPTATPTATATATTAATSTPTSAATTNATTTATPTKAATETPTAVATKIQTSILVRNLTPLDYCSLFIQPSGDSDLGPERLNGDVLTAGGSSTTVFLPEGEYDIQVVDCSGNVTKTQSNVLVITPFEWNIPEHTIELTINNDTSATDICWLFVSLSDEPWGDNILQPNERLQPGGGLFIQLPAGEYDALAENCDGTGVVSQWSNNLMTSNQTWSITD